MEKENINEIVITLTISDTLVISQKVTDVSLLGVGPSSSVSGDGGVKYRIEFEPGAKLVFQGNGMIEAGCTLVGNDTVLVAPIAKIFGDGVAVEGSWKIDRAYPQWFYDDSSMTDAEKLLNADWSGAINSAILMKRTGEVFIPRGDYYVKSPINVRVGINLIGETGV